MTPVPLHLYWYRTPRTIPLWVNFPSGIRGNNTDSTQESVRCEVTFLYFRAKPEPCFSPLTVITAIEQNGKRSAGWEADSTVRGMSGEDGDVDLKRIGLVWKLSIQIAAILIQCCGQAFL